MTKKKFITQGGGVTSLFGVYLPPKRVLKPEKHLTIRFVLEGHIPSKKNMIRADHNLYTLYKSACALKSGKACAEYIKDRLRVFVRNSGEYQQWMVKAKAEIQFQSQFWRLKYEKFGFIYPLDDVSIKVYHYWNDNKERDLTNKLDTINDLLVDSGVICNDNWQTVNQIHSECGIYSGEIVKPITTIDITQRFYKQDEGPQAVEVKE